MTHHTLRIFSKNFMGNHNYWFRYDSPKGTLLASGFMYGYTVEDGHLNIKPSDSDGFIQIALAKGTVVKENLDMSADKY